MADINGIPYLKVPPDVMEDSDPDAAHPLGFVWSGNPKHENDLMRSLPEKVRDQIGDIADFISLNPEHTGAKTWADTAAVVQKLPAVVTVDTSVAHLAGAIGTRVFLLLPYNNDWRWGLSGDRTPWYDEMQIFRCPSYSDWAPVIEQLKSALKELR